MLVLRELEEQGQVWQIKDRRRRKSQPQNEQEAEIDDAEKSAEHQAASDSDTGNKKSTSKFAKQSDFY